jgi:hypothetical protein
MTDGTNTRTVHRMRSQVEMIEVCAALTGPISYQMLPYFPTTYDGMRQQIRRCEGRGTVVRKRTVSGERYLRPVAGALGEKQGGICGKCLFPRQVEGGRWSDLLSGMSKAAQIAFLSGAEIGGTVYSYAPDPLRTAERMEMRAEAMFGPVRGTGEGAPLESSALDRILYAGGDWPLYEPRGSFLWGGKQQSGVKALGLLYAKGALWAIYVVDDIRSYGWAPNKEKEMRRRTEGHVCRELKGLFITLRRGDSGLLMKKGRTRKEKEMNPRMIRPGSVYADYRAFHISEAEEVQELTGRFARYRGMW